MRTSKEPVERRASPVPRGGGTDSGFFDTLSRGPNRSKGFEGTSRVIYLEVFLTGKSSVEKIFRLERTIL
jgi:hypothetical protein